MSLIQKGNSKLIASDMLMFNLPATKFVCGRICPNCYAHKEQNLYPNVLPARETRLQASQQADFVQRMHDELSKKKKRPKYFRVHASGDFYSQKYIDDWAVLASWNSDITFYAYTKRLKKFNFTSLQQLPNFVLINSLHFKGLNYGPITSAPKEAFICPDQKGSDTQCGVSCTWCMHKGQADEKGVWFVKH